MVTVSTTAKTNALGSATRSTGAYFSTASTSYVDTNVSLSVNNNEYYSGVIYFGSHNTPSGVTVTYNFQLLQGATQKVTGASTATSGQQSRGMCWFSTFQNTSGGAETVKIQIKTNNATYLAGCASASFVFKSTINTWSELAHYPAFGTSLKLGTFNYPFKISVTTVSFMVVALYLPAGLLSTINPVRDTTYTYDGVSAISTNEFVSFNEKSDKVPASQSATEVNPDTIPTSTINNIVTTGLVYYTKNDVDDRPIGLIYDWGGTRIEVT